MRGLLESRHLSIRQFAKRLGRPERTVNAWLMGTNEPLRESSVIAQMAAALVVPEAWLKDGRDGPAPTATVPQDLGRLADAVTAKYRRLAFALADDATADWLLAQLDLYERAKRGGRGGPG